MSGRGLCELDDVMHNCIGALIDMLIIFHLYKGRNVSDKEMLIQTLDIIVVISLFVIGCILGKLVMEWYDTWLSFNGPAIGIVIIGELFWRIIKKSIVKKLEMRDTE